jgi:3-methyladenine DNA glycosylase/8-oxoguanine DNA glycosylase
MFPRPESIAGASLDELRACGLSRQKTDYVRAFAQRVSGAG